MEKNTVKLHHPTGHPFWQRNKFKVEFDNKFIDCWQYSKHRQGEYEITVDDKGIYVQYFWCSSGGGKRPDGKKHLLIDSKLYNKIEYIGKPLVMSKELIQDIEEQRW
jgi:hypothetical protein